MSKKAINTTSETLNHPKEVQAKTWLILALMAAVLAFGRILFHEFVNFDDDKGILYNPLLNPVSGESFVKMLTTPNLGMYAPLTNILYGIIALVFGLKPEAFHLTSLVLHLVNIFLVYSVMGQLFKNKNFIIGAVTLIFAIHPFQAEPIAWAAALSTPLYALFYLLALNAYVKYSDNPQSKYLIWTILFFMLSILSKSSAITLPIVLLAIDYLNKRDFVVKVWLEKIPFFVLSIGFGVLTLLTRSAEGHSLTLSSSQYSLIDRFWMISETILFYVFKFVLPLNLCISYPFEKINGSWSIGFYLAPIGVLLLIWILWKAYKNENRVLAFGILMFLVSISVMLPYVTIGNFELKSDRYNYLSVIGLAIVFASYIENHLKSSKSLLLPVVGVFFLIMSFMRTGVWENSITLFSDVIQKTKNQGFAYYNRGLAYFHKEQYAKAVEDFEKASSIDGDLKGIASKKGFSYLSLNNLPKAKEHLQKAITEDATDVDVLKNLGKVNLMSGDLQSALQSLNRASQLQGKDSEIYYMRGLVLSSAGQNKEALDDYGMAIALNTKYTEAYINRGNVLATLEEYDKALADYNQAIGLNPNLPNVYNNRGNVYLRQQQFQKAVADFDKALALNPNYSKAAASRQEALKAMGK